MRKCLLLLVFTCFSVLSFAQPSNDECANAIDLGFAPNCPNETVYTNVDATASIVTSDNNTPVCFSTVPDRDVWFTFTVPVDATVLDFTLQMFSYVDNGIGIQNPQIAVYRIDGNCDELAEYSCVSSADGATQLTLDLVGLTPGQTYYLRVNDYSATGTPNAGEFTLCIGDYNPTNIMCTDETSTACSGVLLDSGGEDGDYSPNENCTFTICPSQANACIEVSVVNYNIENNYDYIYFYGGATTSAPVIATLTGVSNGNDFKVVTSNDCMTIGFSSDGGGQQPGFELSWSCSAVECNSATNDITSIGGLPYDVDNLTTCDNDASFQQTGCGTLPFMAGPESIFAYTTDGTDDNCYSLNVTGAAANTGILVLDGFPTDPTANCIAFSANGLIASVAFNAAQTYYIVVANGDGCTDFGLEIEEASCTIDPSLQNALCNPINGCLSDDGLPSVFNFNVGFTDIEVTNGVNGGCWFGVGSGNFYWFTFQAAADGPFGFTFQAASPDEQSDIDFNVWGPFTNEQVCGTPQDIISIIETTQPLASSYSGGNEPTGLADISPLTGVVQNGLYDCQEEGEAANDDFVQTIPTTEGEVYVILVNDWGGNIESGVVQVDFSASGEGVLDPIDQVVEIGIETGEVCQGSSVQLEIESVSNNIVWTPAESLSCSNCPNPIATPSQTTEYTVTIDGICIDAIGTTTVNVYNADAGADRQVCLGEQIQINAGQDYVDGVYSWTGQEGTMSCTDCPMPTITANAPGIYTYEVTLTAPGCTIVDEMTLTVFPQAAAVYEVAPDVSICSGESYNIGGTNFPTIDYTWTSVPVDANLDATNANPLVAPTQTTTYYLTAINTESGCPNPSIDSVMVEVSVPVVAVVNPSISICQGDTTVLSTLDAEDGVTYSWSPTIGIIGDVTTPDVSAAPTETTTYTLTATRGACQEVATITVEVNEISINITSPAEDSIGLCIGEQVAIQVNVSPANTEVVWLPAEGLSAPTGTSVTAMPTDPTHYFAQVEIPGCVRKDSVFIDVDSLPSNMAIMPQDTLVCQGDIVVLSSPVYDPVDFPEITHQWSPSAGFETPDSLYNMVIRATETTTYVRETTVGFCSQIEEVTVNVNMVSELVVSPQNTVICPGDTVQLMVGPGENTGITSYSWEPADGLSCTDCETPIAVVSQSTTYIVTGDDGTECPPMGTVTITVEQFNPQLPSGVEYCTPQTVNLNNVGFIDPAHNYTWTSTDGTFTSNDANPTFDLQGLTTFEYTISSAEAGCSISGTINLSIASESSVTIEGAGTACAGETVTLNAVTPTGNGAFLWSTGETTPSIAVDASGLYTVQYIPNAECPDNIFDAEHVLTVYDYPVISSIENERADCIFEGEDFTLTAVTDLTVGTGTYDWTYSNSGATTGVGSGNPLVTLAPDVIPESQEGDSISIIYNLSVTNEGGCTSTSEISVCIKSGAYSIPNVFTPNNDDVNATFAPLNVTGYTIETFQVYNRWGQKVFDAIEENKRAWDGKLNDIDAPADVYVWVLSLKEPNGNVRTEKGDVTLIR